MSADPGRRGEPGSSTGSANPIPSSADEPDLTDPAPADYVDLAHEALAAAQRFRAGSGSDSASSGLGSRRRRRPPRARRVPAQEVTWSGAGTDVTRDPQRLGAIARDAFAERGWQRQLTEARVFTDWPRIVGADIASHCRPTALRDGELRVEAQSSAWATQIRLLSVPLLSRLATELGANVVTRLSVSGPAGPSWRHGYRTVPGARGPRDTYG